MTKKKIISIIIMMLISISIKSQSYSPFGFECNMPEGQQIQVPSSFIGGYFKPESIERYTSEQSAYFPVIIVYVQFPNDPGADVEWWPSANNQPPTYMGDILAEEKRTNTNWWNAYDENTETLSDFWMEASRGKLHLVGREVHVVLPYEFSYYSQFSNGIERTREDLFNALATAIGSDWPLYDKWEKQGETFVYGGDGDGYVDMLYIVARSNPSGYFTANGVFYNCTHGNEHMVYQNGPVQIKLRGSFSEIGSGFQICGSPPLPKWAMVSFTGHEHGHYLMGPEQHYWEYHQPYSKVNNYQGYEEYLSPYELLRLGYHMPRVVDFSNESNYSIDDFVSFDDHTESQILKVPIGSVSRNEFFILANRQHKSKFDHLMWGDTAHNNPYRYFEGEAVNYGKGVYIYHAYPGQIGEGYPWSSHIDIECADGLYDWVQDGYAAPDWDPNNPWIPYFKKSTVVYNMNDNGGNYNSSQSLYRHDGLSLGYYERGNWFGLGKKQIQINGDGTDRVWSNRTQNFNCNPDNIYEVWTSRELLGDRWDAWKTGYNEVFSPYSSPSTLNWDNEQTGIFIYLESQSGFDAALQIYKVDEPYSEDQILQWTPPSKPMGLDVDYYYPSGIGNGPARPKITWNHNLEPDMLRADGKKRYKIFRAVAYDLTKFAISYTEIATVDILASSQPEFIDLNLDGECGVFPDWGQHIKYPARYKVKAVDKYETGSVLSDFAAFVGVRIIVGGGGEEDNILNHLNNELPTVYSLLQNYPNPFNPFTEIKYALPRNSFVSVKVYNLAGELVETLVNEYKDAGYYRVAFDGTNLASGVYFYTIEAGKFKASKKMVLVK